MTNNDELWMKLEAAESDELALNGNEVSNQLRHLADNEIDSDSFAVVNENYNGSEVEFERPITDLAIDAAEVIDALLAERDADKKRIEMLEKYVDERDAQNQELLLNIGSLQQRIAELEARTVSVKLPERCECCYSEQEAALFDGVVEGYTEALKTACADDLPPRLDTTLS